MVKRVIWPWSTCFKIVTVCSFVLSMFSLSFTISQRSPRMWQRKVLWGTIHPGILDMGYEKLLWGCTNHQQGYVTIPLITSLAARYGKEKVKRHFLYLYLAITIAKIVMRAVDGTSRLSFINKCYGRDHEVFLIETSSLGVLKRKFWTSIQNQDKTMLDLLLHMIKRIMKILETIIFLALGFNLTEIIVYRKIFSHLDR